MFFIWVLIAGGLLWLYQGITGMNLQQIVLGQSLANVIEIIVGIDALVVIYMQLTMPKKARK
jgi:uncharacterized membrane protein YuzA (DUF378 family)